MPRRALIKSPWGLACNLSGERRRRTPEPCWMWEIHQVSQSPLMWYTHPGDMQAVRLDEIVAALEPAYGADARRLRPPKQANADRTPSTVGRNCALFDSVRFYCYNHHLSDQSAILDYAAEINATFTQPLGHREVANVAKSIARYMATHDGRSRVRGRDYRAGAGLTTAQKQQISGRKTAETRTAKTDNAIATAWLKLAATGKLDLPRFRGVLSVWDQTI